MAIETSGFFNWSKYADLFTKLDLIFIDIKHMDSSLHQKLTGVDNKLILDNIKKLAGLNKDIVVRIPLIKDVNDDRNNINATANFVKEHVDNGCIEILPYHQFGVYKYDQLGLTKFKNHFKTPLQKEITAIKDAIRALGVNIIDFK
jgi:pyruvate formate lyase activating enzyme